MPQTTDLRIPIMLEPRTVPQFCLLPDAGLLEVRGADASSFLHAQLSQDIESLSRNLAPLGAWNSAAGRVRTLFRLIRDQDRFLLLTPRELCQSLCTELGMYVLRAQVELVFAEDLAVA